MPYLPYVPRPRLLLADDHLMFLEGLIRLLAADFEVIGTARDGLAVQRAVELLEPDVAVVDLAMPGRNGLEISRDLLAEDSSRRIIILTMHADVRIAASALRAGVRAFLIKDEAAGILKQAIHRAVDGEISISPCLDCERLRTIVAESGPTGTESSFELTRRQKEVLVLLADGLTLKEVAAALNISIKTVEFHKYTMMDRLGARTTARLVRYADALGLARRRGSQ